MRARQFNPTQTPTGEPVRYVNTYVSEALANQAAMRKPRGEPRAMPVTPVLPRVPKPHKRRRP